MSTLSNIIPATSLTLVTRGGTGVTTLTGIAKGNGTAAFTAASAGTDYVSPTGSETLTNKTITSATLTGTTQAITASNGTSNVMVATTEFVFNNMSAGLSTGKSIAMAMIFGF